MSAEGVSVLSVGTTRLYPRPYIAHPPQAKQDQKSAASKAKKPFADLDRLLASAAASIQQEPLPSHRWEHSATESPVGAPRSILIAQQSLVAFFFTNRLQVYNTATSRRLFEFVFESEDGESKWPITDVVECSLIPQGATTEESIASHTLLVSIMTGPESGKIYLIDFVNARTLLWMNVPFAVTKLLPAWSPTSWSPQQQGIVTEQGLYGKFKEPLVMGTRGGVLVVMDMFFEHSSLQEDGDDRKLERWTEQVPTLTQYEPLSWQRSRRGLSHPWCDLTRPWVNGELLDAGVFEYLDPKPGEFVGLLSDAQKVARESVSITALHLLWPNPSTSHPTTVAGSAQAFSSGNGVGSSNTMDASTEIDVRELLDAGDPKHSSAVEIGAEPSNWIPGLATPLLLVGYNFGVFQIWCLDTQQLLYCSPVIESRSAVTSFQTQSLHNLWGTPNENKVLIWVGRGSISTCHTQQAHSPSISCYGLSLIMTGRGGMLLGSSHPPTDLSDCISSVVCECSTVLPSPYEGDNYYGQILAMQALPCWESSSHNNSSIAFVFETFPPRPISPQQPHQAISKHNTSIPTKYIECHILSTSSLSTGTPELFPASMGESLLDFTMPYQVDPLTKDHSHTLCFSIIPASVQHYFPAKPYQPKGTSQEQQQQQQQQLAQNTMEEDAEGLLLDPLQPEPSSRLAPVSTRAHVSFNSIAVTNDSIWKIGYASHGQQLLNAISEQGPLIFYNPEVISSVLELMGRRIPKTDDELHSLRDELFTIALESNLAGAICEYVLDAASNTSSSLASLSLNIRSTSSSSSSGTASPNLHHVLVWARRSYLQALETSYSLMDQVLGAGDSAEVQELIQELSQARRFLNDLFNIIKSLTLRYKTQRQKWDTQEAHMYKDLEKISLGRQYVECGLWFAHNPINFDPDVLKHKVEIRRNRVIECARNSPTQWTVTLGSDSDAFDPSSASSSPPFSVSAKPFDPEASGLLQIDHLLKSMAPEDQPVTTFEFPPTSSKALVDLCRHGESIFIGQKHQVIFYILLDISEALAEDFATRMMMTTSEQDLVRGLHHVDANNYDAAMRYLNDTRVVAIMNDGVALHLLRTLNDAHAFPHALSLYRVRQPPLDSLDSVVLALYVLLSNGLVSDAFFMARNQSRTTMDSFDPLYLHTLFFHFLRHSYNNNILKDVFQLPLDAVEAEALKRFLVHIREDKGRASDLQMVYLLQRNHIAEAVSWYHSQRRGQSAFDTDPENEKMKTTLLNSYVQTLPPVVRADIKPAEISPAFGFGARSTSSFASSSRPAMQTTAANANEGLTSSSASISGTPSKKLVTKLFNSSQKPSVSSARFAPASLGPALLSPTTPGKFARSPALFRPTVVLSTPAKDSTTVATSQSGARSFVATGAAGETKSNLLPTSMIPGHSSGVDTASNAGSDAPRPSLFSPLSRNLFGSPKPLPSASNIPLTSSTMQPATPFVIPRDSLIEEESVFAAKGMPTAPISTPTKRVMETVKQQSQEATRQSRAIADIVLLESDDEGPVAMDETDDVHGMIDLDDEEDEEEEIEEEEVEEIDDDQAEEVEEAEDAASSSKLPTNWDYVQQLDSESEEPHSRGRGRRTAGTATMDLDEASIDDEALERIRGAHSVDHSGDEGEEEEEEEEEEPETDGEKDVEERSETATSIAETVSRHSRKSARSALSKLSETTKSTRASTTSKAKKSSSSQTSKRGAAAAASKTKLETVAEEGSGADITPASSHRSKRSTRSSIAPPSAAMDTSASAAATGSRRSTRRASTAPNSEEPAAPQNEEEEVPARSSRRSSRLSATTASAASSMVVDEPETTGSRRSTRRNLSNLSAATAPPASRRVSYGLSEIPSEPLGIHPQADDGEASDSGASDISGDTARIRRSSRPKSTKAVSSTAVTSRAKALKVKDRTRSKP